MKSIAAVLVNYNDGEDIVRSTKNLLSYKSVNLVIVVDNNSTDGSKQFIQNLMSTNRKLRVIENSKNLGFSKAINMGISQALASNVAYVAILNPDLLLKKGIFKKLLLNDEELVQITLKYKNGKRWVYDFGGKVNWALGRTYHIESYKPTNPHPEISPDYVCGGAAIIKNEVFKKIGFFDEDFFMYYEDVEFSLRARKAGFAFKIDPEVIIEHRLEIVKNSRNESKLKNNLKANLIFIKKCVPWYFKLTALIFWCALWLKIHLNLWFFS